MVGAGEEVIFLAVLGCGAVEFLVGAVEELKDRLVFLDGQFCKLVVGGGQFCAVFGFERRLFCGVFDQIFADEQPLGVGHLWEAPALPGAIRVDLVGIDHQAGEGFEIEFGVDGIDIVGFDDPARFGQGAEPLAVGDNQVELLGFGGQGGGHALEEGGEGGFGFAYGDVVAIFFLHCGGEGGEHFDWQLAGGPAGDDGQAQFEAFAAHFVADSALQWAGALRCWSGSWGAGRRTRCQGIGGNRSRAESGHSLEQRTA